jgi:AmiR/NasT family two-component response regulator
MDAGAEIAQRHWPKVILLDWEIAKRNPERARIGIRDANEIELPVILITGFERPEVSNIAESIGGCIAVVERLDTLEQLKREIAAVVSCAEGS